MGHHQTLHPRHILLDREDQGGRAYETQGGQAAESQEKGVQAVRLRLADIYGGMISSRLKEDAALPVLAQSIARHGLLQPIVVQENEENGRYMLVWRRAAACSLPPVGHDADRRSADSGEKAGRGRVFSGRPFYPADGPFF